MSGAAPSVLRAGMLYTLLRALLLVIAVVLLTVVGLRGLPLVAVALLVSSVAGLLVLRPQRDALALAVASARERKDAQRAELRARLDAPDQPA